MRAVIQRVLRASVTVNEKRAAEIGSGLLVFLGVAKGDTEKEADWLAHKIANLRILEDQTGKMNLSIRDVRGEALVVSQFTLCADAQKGNRPSFIDAMEPAGAEKLCRYFVETLKKDNIPVKEGVFGAKMAVELVNWGPVTILLESEKK
jgi:D-tyrosyl-tRNA(Tyr) deacylase